MAVRSRDEGGVLAAGDEFEEENAEAEDVGLCGELPVHHVLWRHVSAITSNSDDDELLRRR